MDDDIRSFLEHRGHSSAYLGGDAHEPTLKGDSVFAKRLLVLFGWGHISGNIVQWLAEGARLDGVEREDVNRLARVGSSGRYSGNVRRDLIRVVCDKTTLPTLTLITTHVVAKDGVVEEHGYPMLNPLHVLRRSRKWSDTASMTSGGKSAQLTLFWRE